MEALRQALTVHRARISQHLREIVTFGVIGVVATATHATAALLAQRYLHLVPMVANLVGYCTAFSISYFGNARLTFRRPAMHGTQFLRFMAISLVGLGLSETLTFVGVNLLGLPFKIALIPVVTLVPLLNFILSKLYAFADREKPETPTAAAG